MTRLNLRWPGHLCFLIMLLGIPCAAADRVVFGSDHNYPPFEYLNENGNPVGFNIDLIKAIAAAEGFEVEIRLGPWHEIRAALEVSGKVHISDMFYSEQRAELVDFATPYSLIHDVVFAHRDHPDACRFEHLQNVHVGAQRGSYVDDYLKSHAHDATISLTESEPEALQKLASGEFDCAIISEIVGHFTITKLGLNNVVSSGKPVLPREYGFVVKKGNHELLQRLNAGLRTVNASGEYSRLYNHWFGSSHEASMPDVIKRYSWFIALLAVIIFGILFYSLLLRRQVYSHTASLRKELEQHSHTELMLRESEQRFVQLAENIDEVMWILDPSINKVLYISPSYETVWGRTCASLYKIPRSFVKAIHTEDRGRVLKALEGMERGEYNEEYRVVQPNGDVRWVTDRGYPILNEKGEVYRVAGIARDITERKLAEERIEHLATRDPLTDLPNRYLLNDRLAQGLIHAQRNNEMLAVLFIDLDNFKNINDSLGHSIGDRLLQKTGERIQACLRKEDTLSRLGGDEFIVLIKGLTSAREIAPIADKILAAVATPSQIEGHSLSTACSIGISIYPIDATDADTLMRNADTAMYHAKSSGRHNFQFFSQEMNERAVERLTLENDMRNAIIYKEFCVYYQAKIDISSGKIIGAEALLRWQHPVRGLLEPSVFIPIAEESGLIIPLGGWMIKQTIDQIQSWHQRGVKISIAANLSARQLQPELIEFIEMALHNANLPKQSFELEITESVMMEYVDENIELLQRLHNLGVNISIDDFGTGYSSLSYLKRFPIHALKIDKSFVQDIETDSGSLAIAKALIALARSLHLKVIAEGVETHGQLSALRAMDVDEYQGYIFNKPEPREEFEKRLDLAIGVEHNEN